MTEKTKILEMLSNGKITVQDAEKLLAALSLEKDVPSSDPVKLKQPKFLRIEVNSNNSEKGPETVNIKVPFQLLRAGVKLTALMPDGVKETVNTKLNEKGIHFDLNNLKSSDLDELINELQNLSINVDSKNEKVRIFVD